MGLQAKSNGYFSIAIAKKSGLEHILYSSPPIDIGLEYRQTSHHDQAVSISAGEIPNAFATPSP